MQEIQDYRDFIRSQFENQQKTFPGLTYQKLAEACRIQKAYLSRVIQKKADLSRDQVFLICEVLQLDQNTSRFLFLLHDFSRSAVTKRRKILESEIRQLTADMDRTERKLQRSNVVDQAHSSDFSKYFLDIDVPLVHMFLTIHRYRENVKLISQELNMNEKDLKRIFVVLEGLGLVEWKNGKIAVLRDDLHLPKDSPFYHAHRALMRLKVLNGIQEKEKESRIFSYSALFSNTKGASEIVRTRFLEFIKNLQAEIPAPNPSHVYQLGFDVVRWSDDSG